MVKCPRCGYENEEGAQNCANCRINLVWAMGEKVEATGEGAKEESLITCPRCGHENPEGVQNCANCRVNLAWAMGETAEATGEVAPAPSYCPNCGERAQEGKPFCANCGARLVEEAPRPPVPQPWPAKAEPPKKKTSWAGWVILALIAVVIFFIWAGSAGERTTTSDRPRATSRPRATARPSKITVSYFVRGTAKKASLTYTNATGATEQKTVSIPWDITFKVTPGEFLYLSVQNKGQSGSVSCQIDAGGKTLERAESSGAYVIASCSGMAR